MYSVVIQTSAAQQGPARMKAPLVLRKQARDILLFRLVPGGSGRLDLRGHGIVVVVLITGGEPGQPFMPACPTLADQVQEPDVLRRPVGIGPVVAVLPMAAPGIIDPPFPLCSQVGRAEPLDPAGIDTLAVQRIATAQMAIGPVAKEVFDAIAAVFIVEL